MDDIEMEEVDYEGYPDEEMRSDNVDKKSNEKSIVAFAGDSPLWDVDFYSKNSSSIQDCLKCNYKHKIVSLGPLSYTLSHPEYNRMGGRWILERGTFEDFAFERLVAYWFRDRDIFEKNVVGLLQTNGKVEIWTYDCDVDNVGDVGLIIRNELKMHSRVNAIGFYQHKDCLSGSRQDLCPRYFVLKRVLNNHEQLIYQ